QALACGFGDGTVKVIDLARDTVRMSVKAHTVRAWSVAFSPDDRILASGGWDGTVKLWDVDTGDERGALAAHQDRVYAIAFLSDGKRLISGGGLQNKRGEAKLWDLGKLLNSRPQR